MSATASLVQVTLTLMLMVGLILGLAWLAKRFARPLFQQNNQLRLIASLSLGVKEKIILVEVDGKQLVLGVTPQQITSLHVMDVSAGQSSQMSDHLQLSEQSPENSPEKSDTEKSNTEKSNKQDKTIASEFSKKLMEILKGNKMTS